jgi:hypothetical protein
MALKRCHKCGVQVSREAEVCPHCGVRSPTDPTAWLTTKNVVFATIFTLVLIFFLMGQGPKQQIPYQLTKEEQKTVDFMARQLESVSIRRHSGRVFGGVVS